MLRRLAYEAEIARTREALLYKTIRDGRCSREEREHLVFQVWANAIFASSTRNQSQPRGSRLCFSFSFLASRAKAIIIVKPATIDARRPLVVLRNGYYIGGARLRSKPKKPGENVR